MRPARPAGDRPDGAQVTEVVQRGVGDDHVVRSAHPQNRRLGFQLGQAADPEVGRCHRVQHPAVTGGESRPRRHLPRGARVVIVTDPGGEHRLHEDVKLGRNEGRLHVVGEQYLPRRRGAFRAPVAGGQARHEIRVDRSGARPGGSGVAERPVRPVGAAEAEGRDGRNQGHRRGPVRGGPLGQVLQHRSAPHAPAHEVHRRQRQRLDDGGQVVGVVAEASRGVHRFRVRVTEAAQVYRQRPVALR